jgi:hypothetical protein
VSSSNRWRLCTLVTLAALALAGCIDSAQPILTDAKPVLGQHLRVQLFAIDKGRADEPALEEFVWDGQRYASSSAKPTIEPFTAFPYGDGDFIVQTVSTGPKSKTEYALLHKLGAGVYLARVIDEDDADEATRKACRQIDKFTCRIETRDQLLTFVKATAAKHHESGGLVVMMGDKPAKK